MDKSKIKRIAIRSGVVVALIFLASQDVRLFGTNDKRNPQADELKVIRRAMAKESRQENPSLPFNPCWVKIWIKNERRPDKEIKITLPAALVDLMVAKAELGRKSQNKSLQGEDDFSFLRKARWQKATRIRFLDIWKELKALGRTSVVEMRGEEGFLRIWLE